MTRFRHFIYLIWLSKWKIQKRKQILCGTKNSGNRKYLRWKFRFFSFFFTQKRTRFQTSSYLFSIVDFWYCLETPGAYIKRRKRRQRNAYIHQLPVCSMYWLCSSQLNIHWFSIAKSCGSYIFYSQTFTIIILFFIYFDFHTHIEAHISLHIHIDIFYVIHEWK